MKLWTTEHTFSHPWKKVTEAAWKKYPNELNTNVTAIDVIDRKVTDNGKLYTTRIFGSTWNLPTFITTLLGMPDSCYAVEHSEVDVKNERMVLKMINYTFWGILAVEETLVYEPDKENPNQTSLTQGAKISVNGIHFSNYFEDVICTNFESTSQKGRKALQQVLTKLEVESIISTVTKEIQELSADIDKATSKINEEFHISEKLQGLSKDLDKATSIINSELQLFSEKLTSEFSNLISKLDTELDQITIKVSSYDDGAFSNIGLSAAVKQSGISAISSDINS